MNGRNVFRWTVLLLANLAVCAVLSLYRPISAAPKDEVKPFANSVEQRAEMIALLKEIHAQLKQQNNLLSSGKLTVVVAPPDGAAKTEETAPSTGTTQEEGGLAD